MTFRRASGATLHVELLAPDKTRWSALSPLVMVPSKQLAKWKLPAIATVWEFAEWLGVKPKELEWFADRCGIEATTRREKLRHYHYRPLTKQFGTARLIEAPKPRLKAIQRQLLTEIVGRIPPHGAAHGFRRGRSIKTFAAGHTGKRVVLRMDLADFFPSISMARVRAIFLAIGYPKEVSDMLASMCTNSAPRSAWGGLHGLDRNRQRQTDLYRWPHLPQGAPTSPALANLCAYRLDCRLTGLARSAGANYTRYADDLAFSGDQEFERSIKRFSIHVSAYVMEEGFTVNFRKTRIMRQGVRQQLAGVVVNQHPNIPRSDYDRLKATLHNCIRHGPESQNREGRSDWRAHLTGRIAFVEMVNPARGERLRELLGRIEW